MSRALSFSDSALPGLLRLFLDKAPETTLGDLLADPSIGALARGTSLRQLAAALQGGASAGAASPAAAAGARAAGSNASRKPKARRSALASSAAAYDAAVLVEIVGAPEPIGAVAIRSKAGGSPAEFRAAAERLIAAKKVKKFGIAKGTRYRAG
jgi:hypothetical protein